MDKFYSKQKGAALILVAFIIALASTAYLLRAYNPTRLSLEQDRRTYLALSHAKQALIDWAVSHENYPGQLTYPDRREVVNPNYDGKSDCPPSNTAFLTPNSYSLFLGQLPISGQDAPCENPFDGLGEDFQDAQGNRLWYAVSRNLVHHYEFLLADPSSNPVINPSIISNPTYPWLRLLDRNGALISDRVAVVIIAPGNALTGQNRAGVAPTVNQYLDTFQIGASVFSNADYDSADEDFIIGQDSSDLGELDNSVTKPYYFNDKLVYITIDELILAITNRAGAEAAMLLNAYQIKNGQFPYAANLGAALNSHISSGVATNGMLPIDVTDNCGCSSDNSCTCSFQPISSVTMYRNSGTWDSAQDVGLCSSGGSTKNCTCTGAGSCSRFGTIFSCTSLGECTHNLPATPLNKYVYKVNSYADFNSATLGCAVSANPLPKDTVECNNAGSFTIGLREADWFKGNLWQDYFYYTWSATSDLQAGARVGISALLIGTSEPIINPPFAVKGAPQSRPPINLLPNLDDYLDIAENTNGDTIFNATNQAKTNAYNDQVYVVAP